jgi:hypothetical protein
MDFRFDTRTAELHEKLNDFMHEEVYPAEPRFEQEMAQLTDPWARPPVIEALKASARDRDLWNLFHELADGGAAVLVSSHVMDEAERCHRLLLMREGRIIADGSPREIRERTGAPDIEGAFLHLVGAAA